MMNRSPAREVKKFCDQQRKLLVTFFQPRQAVLFHRRQDIRAAPDTVGIAAGVLADRVTHKKDNSHRMFDNINKLIFEILII